MIVILKQPSKGAIKAMVSDSVFFEVNEDNKKLRQISPGSISGVYSLHSGEIEFLPPREWLELAQEKNFWGAG